MYIQLNMPMEDNPVLNNNEQWLSIKDFDNYEVSNTGKIRNSKKVVMKTFINNSGYETIKLYKNSKYSHKLVHRLVIEAFNPSIDITKTEVNHIDENKLNNNLYNLKWVTSSENKQHSIKSGRYDKIKETKNSLGKKHLPNTKSKYHNVSYDKNRNKWTAMLRINGKNVMQKRFNTEIEAALHVNYIIDTLGLTDRPKNIIES